MNELKTRYMEFITEYDPYYQDEAETPEEMLYNLLNIKADFETDINSDSELFEVLVATISQFKAAGIEII